MVNKVPRINYPHLFSFVKTKNISVNFARNAGPETLLHLPLSPLAAAQLIELAQDLNSLPIIEEQDIWSYIWGSPFFSTSKAYTHLTGHMPTHPFFRWLWKASCQNKHKLFFWLLLQHRLSTRDLLRRRNMNLPSYNCVCCNLGVDETLSHLLFMYPLRKHAGSSLTLCWWKLIQ